MAAHDSIPFPETADSLQQPDVRTSVGVVDIPDAPLPSTEAKYQDKKLKVSLVHSIPDPIATTPSAAVVTTEPYSTEKQTKQLTSAPSRAYPPSSFVHCWLQHAVDISTAFRAGTMGAHDDDDTILSARFDDPDAEVECSERNVQ